MDVQRLKIKVGEHEFEAEGSPEMSGGPDKDDDGDGVESRPVAAPGAVFDAPVV